MTIAPENVEAAKAAGLRYVRDEVPGITRRKQGAHFIFFDPSGKRITERAEIERIRSLAIPPAYTDVWISPIANGHLQATGRDARGRKQYRYHKRWREVRDETKFDRMIDFAKALPMIRAAVDTHLELPGLPREKVLATVVRLLETTLIRVGNEEYAKDNDSYGLSTLERRHVKLEGATVRFRFRGKSGIRHAIDLHDRRLAKIIRACRDIPGQELFQYVDDDGQYHSIDSAAVNDYIREVSGGDFTAKDFRTWVGTVICAMMLQEAPRFESETEGKKHVIETIRQVAERLGNTAAVCRKCYVHPTVIESYMEGARFPLVSTKRARKSAPNGELKPEEKMTLRLLKNSLKGSDADRTAKQLRASLKRESA
ncbi:MAG: DNA topoisomerase IB [Candidatus Eremiobacteraeota bacterium]|nr:DNA topoisomerase IB [Candidatus Eremiobacteraeota bacterium]